jgi:hypothetical protein
MTGVCTTAHESVLVYTFVALFIGLGIGFACCVPSRGRS